MEEQIRVVVYADNYIFDDFVVAPELVEKITKSYEPRSATSPGEIASNPVPLPLKLCKNGLNSYLVSAYVYSLERSSFYRRAALRTLLNFSRANARGDARYVILIKLRMIRIQYLDYRWNEIITQMALERRELDHAMSWLSTLGGGFSALGERFERCAEMAGKISVSQFQLALRLGDPLLVARCKLYAALSLLQRGCLNIAKRMIQENYRLAVSEKDVRLQKMCKGVWAKLQYMHKTQRQLKKTRQVRH